MRWVISSRRHARRGRRRAGRALAGAGARTESRSRPRGPRRRAVRDRRRCRSASRRRCRRSSAVVVGTQSSAALRRPARFVADPCRAGVPASARRRGRRWRLGSAARRRWPMVSLGGAPPGRRRRRRSPVLAQCASQAIEGRAVGTPHRPSTAGHHQACAEVVLGLDDPRRSPRVGQGPGNVGRRRPGRWTRRRGPRRPDGAGVPTARPATPPSGEPASPRRQGRTDGRHQAQGEGPGPRAGRRTPRFRPGADPVPDASPAQERLRRAPGPCRGRPRRGSPGRSEAGGSRRVGGETLGGR